MKNIKLLKLSFLNSAGVLVYIFLVVFLMQNAEKVFGKTTAIVSGVAILSLFVLSAAITGSLVLIKPILFYVEGLKKEAIKLFIFTLGWVFVFTAIALIISFFCK